MSIIYNKLEMLLCFEKKTIFKFEEISTILLKILKVFKKNLKVLEKILIKF